MQRFEQSPTDDAFVQNPYPAYDRARALGDLVWWEEYAMPAAVSHRAVGALLRDRRFGREAPPDRAQSPPAHLTAFFAFEAQSMLEAEPPRHTRLRGLVLRAFTSRAIADLAPAIDAILADLIADLPTHGDVDLLEQFARPLPVRVIARLMGVPEAKAPQLLAWSNAMVGMYQAGRSRAMEDAAEAATRAFSAWLEEIFAARRKAPGDDLLSRLLAAEAEGDSLSPAEVTATVMLLLNAGHEATVHSLGNGLAALIAGGHAALTQDPGRRDALVEEILRHDPPLHIFTRWCYAPCEIFGHRFAPGDRVALVLGAANRDPAVFARPHRFDPSRAPRPHLSLGGGLHFCVGAPLARLELARALPALFAARPGLRLAQTPRYAPIYHFHGLQSLIVRVR